LENISRITREQLWEFMCKINRHALQFFSYSLCVPTRGDIKENIQMHKASRMPSKPAMMRGFDTTFDELLKQINVKLPTNVDRFDMWTEMSHKNDIVKIIQEKDSDALKRIEFGYGIDNIFSDVDMSDDMWAKVEQLNSFASVQKNIPNKMMSRIESSAHKLAGEIATGKTDFSKLNLAQLGQNVLEGCDTEDMEAFTNNMGNLLPVLQNLQQNVVGKHAYVEPE